MSEDMILIALDIDGVINSFKDDLEGEIGTAVIGGWPVRWHVPVLDRLKAVLAHDDVDGVWLTTWLAKPELLTEFAEATGLTDELVRHWAPYPHASLDREDPRMRGTSLSASDPEWWKFRSIEFVIDELKPSRFAWLDDDLGRANGVSWRPSRTFERLLLKSDETAGLVSADLDVLEDFVAEHRSCSGMMDGFEGHLAQFDQATGVDDG